MYNSFKELEYMAKWEAQSMSGCTKDMLHRKFSFIITAVIANFNSKAVRQIMPLSR